MKVVHWWLGGEIATLDARLCAIVGDAANPSKRIFGFLCKINDVEKLKDLVESLKWAERLGCPKQFPFGYVLPEGAKFIGEDLESVSIDRVLLIGGFDYFDYSIHCKKSVLHYARDAETVSRLWRPYLTSYAIHDNRSGFEIV